jgi:hypothetical protein
MLTQVEPRLWNVICSSSYASGHSYIILLRHSMMHAFLQTTEEERHCIVGPLSVTSASGTLPATSVTGLHQIVCHTQVMWGTLVRWRTHLAVNKISVGGLTANEYALDWVPLC